MNYICLTQLSYHREHFLSISQTYFVREILRQKRKKVKKK